ncbi:MAG: DMT family transporter [Acidobacteriota bacterium]
MTWTALALVLGCAFGWAMLDLWRKLLSGRLAAVPASLVLVLGQIPLFGLWTAIESGSWPGVGYWLPGLASIVLNLLASVAFMQSVRASAMSRTVPLLSLTPAFATLVAWPMLGEVPTGREWLGIALVVVGALVLARDDEAPTGELLRTLGERGGLLMAFVALCWSITPTVDKLAMEHAAPSVHALVVVVGISLGLAVLIGRQGRFGEVRAAVGDREILGLVLLAVVTGALATALQLVAYQHAPVGMVETVKRGIGPVAALGFGAWLFAERIDRLRVAAVLLMVVGVFLVLS